MERIASHCPRMGRRFGDHLSMGRVDMRSRTSVWVRVFHRRCAISQTARRCIHRRCAISQTARRCFHRRCAIFRSARRCIRRRCAISQTARRCFYRRCGIFRSARRCFHRRCGIFRTGQERGDGRCDTFGSDFLAISSIEGRFVRLLLWDFLESSWRSRGNLITASAP
jgi:hypothetical protein